MDKRALVRAPAAEWALFHVLNHYYLPGGLDLDDDGVRTLHSFSDMYGLSWLFCWHSVSDLLKLTRVFLVVLYIPDPVFFGFTRIS